MRHAQLLTAFLLVLTACTQVTVETTTLSGGTLASANPATVALESVAEAICIEHAWIGIPEPGSFDLEAADLGLAPQVVALAVRRQCPDTFYQPLSKAETDWCGDGLHFGSNFFMVVSAGIDLGIESFSVVESGLVSKVSRLNVEMTDYEIELLTAELQTMNESSRFERDWAEACRLTL